MLAKTEPTPPGVNSSIVLYPMFDTIEIAGAVEGQAEGTAHPVLAKTLPTPPGVKRSIVLLWSFVT